MDVALYLIPRQGLRAQISSIVDTSHFLEVQVTLCCFLLVPQVIGVEMPQFVQPSSGNNGENCACISQDQSPIRSWCWSLRAVTKSPIVSADVLTKLYNSASAESHYSLCFAPHSDEMRPCNCVSSCGTAACSSATCPICV